MHNRSPYAFISPCTYKRNITFCRLIINHITQVYSGVPFYSQTVKADANSYAVPVAHVVTPPNWTIGQEYIRFNFNSRLKTCNRIERTAGTPLDVLNGYSSSVC
jgi:hypothetical protein